MLRWLNFSKPLDFKKCIVKWIINISGFFASHFNVFFLISECSAQYTELGPMKDPKVKQEYDFAPGAFISQWKQTYKKE